MFPPPKFRKKTGIGAGFFIAVFEIYTSPWASIASATFTKPPMLAPKT